jgi:guanylate kinase
METDISDIRGHVVVVMAPMGSGKGTIISHAQEKYKDIRQTISCTSRKIRPGETNGKQYYFISDEEFSQKIENGEFIEWAEFAGNKYGTLVSEIVPKLNDCQVVLVEIEIQGVEQLLKIIPRDHLTITYIEAGGWEELKARALDRAPITETELEARHERFLI